MSGPVVPYESVEHLRDDIEAAKHRAIDVLVFARMAAFRPHRDWLGVDPWEAARDSLDAVWEWLDAIEASAAAVIVPAECRRHTDRAA